jgi:hypothetical protein
MDNNHLFISFGFDGMNLPHKNMKNKGSFLTGAAFTGLFAVRYTGEECATERRLKLGYSVSIFLCFLLTITTLVFSTAALTKSLTDGYNTLTTCGVALLNSEAFHYEFVMTRWSFQMGILFYLTAVMNRILLEFHLLTDPRPKIRYLGIAVCLLMSSLMFHIISFVNTTLITWNNMTEMTIHVIKVRHCARVNRQSPRCRVSALATARDSHTYSMEKCTFGFLVNM